MPPSSCRALAHPLETVAAAAVGEPGGNPSGGSGEGRSSTSRTTSSPALLAGVDGDGHVGAGSVLADVGESLLRDPQHRLPGRAREARRVAVDRQLDRRVGARPVLGHERLDPRRRRHRLAAQHADGLPGLLQPLARERVRALHPRQHRVAVGALLNQRTRRLELNREPGERVRQHVVDLPGDPRRLLEPRRAQLLLVRALGLGEQQLGLFGTHLGLAAGRRRERHGDEPERVGEHADAASVVDEHRRAERERSQRDDEERARQLHADARGGNRHEHERGGGGVRRRAGEHAPGDRPGRTPRA